MPNLQTRAAAGAAGFGLNLSTPPGSGLPAIGSPYEGGYFAGVMRNGATRYALVISPKAQGQTQSASTGAMSANSRWDGLANCTGSSNSIALWARALNINGFTDWYVPAIDELELLYRNFKPTTALNVTGNVQSNLGGALITNPNGANPNSEPVGPGYTTTVPTQTPLALFKAGGAQCLDSTTAPIATWASNSDLSQTNYPYFQRHDAGEENVALGGGNSLTVRAVRRVIL